MFLNVAIILIKLNQPPPLLYMALNEKVNLFNCQSYILMHGVF